MTNEPTFSEMIEILRSSASPAEALDRINDFGQTEKKIEPDFAGFKASDLEDYFNQENLLEDGWDEAGYYLRNGVHYDYNAGLGAVEVPIKPFVHGRVAVEEEDTGGEGHGEDIYIVFSVESYDENPYDGSTAKRFFQKTGYYLSYDGSTWDGEFTEVWPKDVKVTRWVTKKP